MQISSHPLSPEQLMTYLDGELSVDEAAIVAVHLQHCRECQALAANLQRISRYLANWQVGTSHSELFNITDSKATEGWSRTGFFGRHRWALSFCVIAVLLVLIFPLTYLRNPSKQFDVYFPAYKAAPANQDFLSVSSDNKSTLAENPMNRRKAAEQSLRSAQSAAVSDPLIIRTAQLNLTSADFVHVREMLNRILADHKGYIAQLEMTAPTGEARSFSATLRVPALELDFVLETLKRLGHLDSESQRGQEVTHRVVDVRARLSNLRATESRLNDILRQQTGKLSDVLAVEEQIDSIRGQIETTEAEQKSLTSQIAFASIQLKINEEYKKPLARSDHSLSTRLRNAAIEGFQTLEDSAVGLLLFLLANGPILLVIAGLLFFPVRAYWRHRQRAT